MKYDNEFVDDEQDDDTKEKEVHKINNEFVAETISRKTDYEFDKHYMDFALYLISGILLIFILEQFVQLGMMLKDKKTSHTHYHSGYPQYIPQQTQLIQPQHVAQPHVVQHVSPQHITKQFPYTQSVNNQVNI
jgi:hypothetical protein